MTSRTDEIMALVQGEPVTDKDGYPFGGSLLDRVKGVASGSWQLHRDTAAKVCAEIVRLRNEVNRLREAEYVRENDPNSAAPTADDEAVRLLREMRDDWARSADPSGEAWVIKIDAYLAKVKA